MRQQQPPQRHPVRLPAGQPGGHGCQQAADPQQLGQPGQFAAAALGRRRVAEIVAHGQMREEARVLAQQADLPLPRRHRPHRRHSRGQHPSAENDLAAPQRHQPGDGLKDRGLARAGRAEQGQPLPRCDRHGSMHSEIPAVNLDVGVQHGRSRCRRPAAAAGRPPAAPGQTGAQRPGRSPAASYRSAAVSRTDGKR